MKKLAYATVVVILAFGESRAYEINNHADMSEVAALRSSLQVRNGRAVSDEKLFKLGLKPFNINNSAQTFPLPTPQIGGGTPLERCFGQYERLVVDAQGRPILDAQGRQQVETLQDSFATQPGWSNPQKSGTTPMTIAQAIRFGACWEDAEEPDAHIAADISTVGL
jgi:hypothetical protein